MYVEIYTISELV